MKAVRLLVVLVALMAFTVTGAALAAGGDMYYVVKDKQGNMKVVDKKPADPGEMMKGPFKSKEAAKKAMDDAKKQMK